MFYSRPKIEPLGWDLVALPVPDGPKHFDGVTSDGRPVDFRFSGGWLTVERGPVGAPSDCEMEEVLSECISPFGTMDISEEQICDMLGVTVLGQRVVARGGAVGARGFDWSGRTTYWQSTHLMMPGPDARRFTSGLLREFPGSVLIHAAWVGSAVQVCCRQIKFLMETDQVAFIGIGYEGSWLEEILAAEDVPTTELESVFDYSIQFSRDDREGEDVTLSRYITQQGADKLGLNYFTAHHRRYRIKTEYATANVEAQSITEKLLANLESYFCRGLEIIDLQTRTKLGEDLTNDQDEKSYSKELREHCLDRPDRYMYVSPASMAEKFISRGSAQFVGYRPTQTVLPYQARR